MKNWTKKELLQRLLDNYKFDGECSAADTDTVNNEENHKIVQILYKKYNFDHDELSNLTYSAFQDGESCEKTIFNNYGHY